jgi:iron(III) transport system substrate-binding protein
MHRRTGIRILGTGLALAIALGVAGPVAPAAATELLLYSSRHYPKEPAFEAFTKKTGITLKIFHASDAELFERLKAEGDRTPADLLVTVDAGNLWNAARAGFLAPVDSPELDRNIPANFRDPQGRWVALAVRARTIMYNTTRVKPEELSTYAALGDPKWKGRLCLRNSTHIYNQSLLATMIKRYGEPRTEEIVRGWVANQPTLINGDAKILEAIAAGQCDVGVTNTYYLGRALAKDPSLPVRPFWPDQAGNGVHVNISGAGVIAHSKHRAEAIKFLEFLSTPEAQATWAEASFEFPANPQVAPAPLLVQWGTFKMDDINVAAAGEFQAAATKLADRAGYR